MGEDGGGKWGNDQRWKAYTWEVVMGEEIKMWLMGMQFCF